MMTLLSEQFQIFHPSLRKENKNFDQIHHQINHQIKIYKIEDRKKKLQTKKCEQKLVILYLSNYFKTHILNHK